MENGGALPEIWVLLPLGARSHRPCVWHRVSVQRLTRPSLSCLCPGAPPVPGEGAGVQARGQWELGPCPAPVQLLCPCWL